MKSFKTWGLIFCTLLLASLTGHTKAALKKTIQKNTFGHSVTQHNVVLYDSEHDRMIPIAIYKGESGTQKNRQPVVIISHGYGVKNTEYSFIAKNLAAQGYDVMSLQHDLEDDPDLPRTGNVYALRMPFWERGVRSLHFVTEQISKNNPELEREKVILIGHSNGGDISMMFADKYPSKVEKVISLDSLRYPFPPNANILSLRAKDTCADKGVLANNPHAKVIQIKNAKHIDMYDAGPRDVKDQIAGYINDFLRQ